jgi:Zn-dependent peptidase ImmA (M78 family)
MDMTRKKCKRSVRGEGKKVFDEFKEECLRQIERLGLKDWDIEIQHVAFVGEEEDDAANTQFTEEGRVAVISLNKKWTPKDPRRTAKHEIGHVLLGRIHIIASKRWTSEKEMDDEIESLCTRLEKVL